MSTTPNTTDSLPLGTTDAGKPATGNTKPAAKPPVKPIAKTDLPTKATPLNPAWAEEVTGQFGLAGDLAKAATAEIVVVVTAEITRKFDRRRLAKIVRGAAAKAIR